MRATMTDKHSGPVALIVVLIAAFTAGCGAAPSAIGEARALIETDPVGADLVTDAADDPAIFVDSFDPLRSVVIGTNKKAGLYVYGLDGRTIQYLPAGLLNNVDLRGGFDFADGPGVLVGASNRTDQSLTFFRYDPVSRRLGETPAGRIVSGFEEVYGFCLHRAADGSVHAGATSKAGAFRQWRLALAPDGNVTGSETRLVDLGSIAEGCVYDDARGVLYIAEENVGIWRLPADPAAGNTPEIVARTGGPEGLTADVEGLAIYARDDGSGYLVVSSQGDSTFHLFDRVSNAHLGRVRIAAGGTADAVSHTDGIEVTAADLGGAFAGGLLVVQDDENTDPTAAQNFKYVPWTDVEAALKPEQ